MPRFPIGVLADSFRLSPREGVLAAKAVGAAGVQLYCVEGAMAPENLNAAARRDFKAFMDGEGMAFSALCGDLGGHGFERPEEYPDKVKRTRAILDLACDWSCPVVTTHIGMVPDDTAGKPYNDMLEVCRGLGNDAEKRGARFAIETGPEPAALLRRFLEDADSKGLAVNLDPANLIMAQNEDPVESVRLLAPWIVHTHAKDGEHLADWPGGYKAVLASRRDGSFEEKAKRYGRPGREMALGAGRVPWPAYLRALWNAGFRGYLTIEREVGDDPAADIRKAVGFLNAAMKEMGDPRP